MAECQTGFADAWEEAGLSYGMRRPGPAIRTNHDLIQDAVAIKEDGSIQRSDSHFIALTRRSGCDTSRCHTTA